VSQAISTDASVIGRVSPQPACKARHSILSDQFLAEVRALSIKNCSGAGSQVAEKYSKIELKVRFKTQPGCYRARCSREAKKNP